MPQWPESLFDDRVVSTDIVYRNVRDLDSDLAKSAKAYCESLWSRYRGICRDENFLTDIPHQFDQRFWEMYLGCWLMDLPYSVENMPAGPDFRLTDGAGRRIWIEAVCPTSGQDGHPDAVPAMPRGEAFGVPDEKIILRLTSAIEQKNNKLKEDMAKGIVSDKDAFILAINTKQVYLDPNCVDLPRLLKAVCPIGNPYFQISNVPGVSPRSGRWPRHGIEKSNQSPVSVGLFLDPEFSGISAIIGCSIDCANHLPNPDDNFFWIKNLNARVGLPSDLVQQGQMVYTFAIEEDAYRVDCMEK